MRIIVELSVIKFCHIGCLCRLSLPLSRDSIFFFLHLFVVVSSTFLSLIRQYLSDMCVFFFNTRNCDELPESSLRAPISNSPWYILLKIESLVNRQFREGFHSSWFSRGPLSNLRQLSHKAADFREGLLSRWFLKGPLYKLRQLSHEARQLSHEADDFREGLLSRWFLQGPLSKLRQLSHEAAAFREGLLSRWFSRGPLSKQRQLRHEADDFRYDS